MRATQLLHHDNNLTGRGQVAVLLRNQVSQAHPSQIDHRVMWGQPPDDLRVAFDLDQPIVG